MNGRLTRRQVTSNFVNISVEPACACASGFTSTPCSCGADRRPTHPENRNGRRAPIHYKAGPRRGRKTPSGKINANLRSFPPSYAAMMDGCLVEHEIECIRNSNGTFHFETGASIRKVADRAIDRCAATFEDDLRTFEDAVTLCSSAVLRGLFHRQMLRSCSCIDLPGGLAGQSRR